MTLWNKDDCVAFKLTRAKWGEFSNFAPIPVVIKGYRFSTTEALYQALRYPENPGVQQAILEAGSPAEAKSIAKDNYDKTIPEWMHSPNPKFPDGYRVPIMYWVVAQKIKQNPRKMVPLLKETEGKFIVENSSFDDFWGANPCHNGWRGKNVLGCILGNIRNRINDDGSLCEPLYNWNYYTNLIDETIVISI